MDFFFVQTLLTRGARRRFLHNCSSTNGLSYKGFSVRFFSRREPFKSKRSREEKPQELGMRKEQD